MGREALHGATGLLDRRELLTLGLMAGTTGVLAPASSLAARTEGKRHSGDPA